MGEFPSGQRGQTVNLLRIASMVRIRPPPPEKTNTVRCWSFLRNGHLGDGFERPVQANSPVELYECGISCYSLVFCGLFPCFSYDMVTAARCPRTRIVPHNRAEVKRAFCSVSWQTDGASLRSAERVEQQSRKQGAAEDSCPLHLRRIAESVYGFAVCALRVLFRCIVRGCPRNATLQLWCKP